MKGTHIWLEQRRWLASERKDSKCIQHVCLSNGCCPEPFFWKEQLWISYLLFQKMTFLFEKTTNELENTCSAMDGAARVWMSCVLSFHMTDSIWGQWLKCYQMKTRLLRNCICPQFPHVKDFQCGWCRWSHDFWYCIIGYADIGILC